MVKPFEPDPTKDRDEEIDGYLYGNMVRSAKEGAWLVVLALVALAISGVCNRSHPVVDNPPVPVLQETGKLEKR